MAQYQRIKDRHPDALLLFRVGDFYESFGADAIKAAGVLGITLTKRANGAASAVELAGFPYHSLDSYLPRLVSAGLRVAICEQLEDPKLTKTLVKRGVTELVTPGLATSEKLLENRRNHFLAALFEGAHEPESSSRNSAAQNGLTPDANAAQHSRIRSSPGGIALLDLSTGEFLYAQGEREELDRVLDTYKPAEVLIARSRMKAFQHRHQSRYYVYPLEDWIFEVEFGLEKLQSHFRTSTLKGFGIEENSPAIPAAGAVLHYLGQTEHHRLEHISALGRLNAGTHMLLDRFTLRNLELLDALQPDASSLLDVLDRTVCPMGARLLRRWLALPLLDIRQIEQRLDAVEFLVREGDRRNKLVQLLSALGDLERVLARVALGKAGPRDLGQIRNALEQLPGMLACLEGAAPQGIVQLREQLDPCSDLLAQLSAALADELPAQLGKGPVIRAGFNAQLDEYRSLGADGRSFLTALQQREAISSGIASLKVGYNHVFGYYLEVTRRYKDQVPDTWIRKQTLVNAERYITPELKEYEEKILNAEQAISELESRLFSEQCDQIIQRIALLQKQAGLMARLDVLSCFARNALDFQYRRPSVDEGYELLIEQGRHPVIERLLPADQQFVPNDLKLDREEQQILIITGPNMSGKSALLRQSALIALMAQCGSFVPAQAAKIGIVDRLFTRVGASDNLSAGESTFMVEMLETASIANNLSERSLLVLDEIGRGTSTYDGISIAWALAEYLHHHKDRRPRTLFATHYHELSELAQRLPRVHNFHISTRESGGQVIFLRKLTPGESQRSFGIHVARMAGMPPAIVERASELLHILERQGMENSSAALAAEPAQEAYPQASGGPSASAAKQGSAMEKMYRSADASATLRRMPPKDHAAGYQLSIFEVGDPALGRVREILQALDLNQLTPVESLLKLKELQDLLSVEPRS